MCRGFQQSRPVITAALGAATGALFRAITDRNVTFEGYTDAMLSGASVGGLYSLLNSAASAGASALRPDRLVHVSRWGGQAGQPGSWAMRGNPTLGNYLGSGKWGPGGGNIVTGPLNVTRAKVPASSLVRPSGNGIDGFIKGLFVDQWKIR